MLRRRLSGARPSGTDGLCRRHWERRRRANGTSQLAPVPIKATALADPPRILREELERQRARGRSFRAAWPTAQRRALDRENMHVAVFWRRVWGEQRPIWQTSYNRAPWPANQRPALTTPELEHRDHRDFIGSIVA